MSEGFEVQIVFLFIFMLSCHYTGPGIRIYNTWKTDKYRTGAPLTL
jgi:hypothetical protein